MRWMQLLFGAWVGSCVACSSARDNGQTGSVGQGCSECRQQAESALAELDKKATPEFVDSLCQQAGKLGDAGLGTETLAVQNCKCIASDGSRWLIRATGAQVDAGSECLAWGRGHLACVYSTADEVNCDPADARSCDAACSRLQQGYAEDAARSYDTSLRSAQCGSRGTTYAAAFCEVVVRINDACYTNDSNGYLIRGPFDCSLSDDQILAQSRAE